MPRSKDPRNYGPFYEKLSDLMDTGEPDIRLEMSGRMAIYHRNNFYAYINAVKSYTQSIPTSKVLPPKLKPQLLEHWLRKEEVLRKYLVVIDPQPDNSEQFLDSPAELRFVLRGMDERQATLLGQLDKMLAIAGPSSEELKAQIQQQPAFTSHTEIEADMRGPDSPIAHLFEGVDVDTTGMTDEEADRILASDPPDRTDLTDLITEDNQPASIPSNPMEEALKQAEKLRDKEREESKKIT